MQHQEQSDTDVVRDGRKSTVAEVMTVQYRDRCHDNKHTADTYQPSSKFEFASCVKIVLQVTNSLQTAAESKLSIT